MFDFTAASVARKNVRQSSSSALCGRVCALLMLVCGLAGSAGGFAQSTQPPAGQSGQSGQAQAPAAQKPAQQVQRVTTTVVVHGEIKDDYLPDTVTVGTLDGATLEETPLSATVVTRDLLNDQGARLLSDVVKNDASIGEDYAPVGYYGDYEIRGFPIDLATGLQINGMSIAGEQDVPLENKERVEFLKGIAGVESGVASGGGLINYVTKRPAIVEAVDLGTDHRGTIYGAADLGHLFGSRKQVGARMNAAGEKIESYVNDANGWRTMASGAADWKMSPKAILEGNFEYQHKVERSVCGYQLLGGTVVPDLSQVHPSTMLGEQPWSLPNTFDTINTGARLDYDLTPAWKAFAAVSYSHSLINDNVIYAYGCYNEAECNSGSAPYPWFFAPDGTYDIYDYRDPGELRIDAQAEALITGHVKTGAITQDVTGGGRSFCAACNSRASRHRMRRTTYRMELFTLMWAQRIFTSLSRRFLWRLTRLRARQTKPVRESSPRTIINRRRSCKTGFTCLDAFNFSPAAASDSVRDHNDSGTTPSGAVNFTDRTVWLPQYAATFNPKENLTLYGNYGVLLSLGPQAPFWAGGYYLPPFITRQAEIGAKYEPSQRILITTALFHICAPFFYPEVIDGTPTFVSQGRETHDGIEFNAEGKATNWLRLTASAAALRALSDDTGTPAFDNKQVLNVPHLRTALFGDLLLPHAHGLHLLPGWGYTGRKEATRDDLVSVPSYNLFNLGARYTPGGENGRVTLRLYADNITDKRYWKDTGASYGDTFIHLGAPTTVRLSAHYTF